MTKVNLKLQFCFLEFQNTVTRQLLKVLENQEEILRRSAENPTSIAEEGAPAPVELPLSSVPDFEKLNDWLAQPENASSFVSFVMCQMYSIQ